MYTKISKSVQCLWIDDLSFETFADSLTQLYTVIWVYSSDPLSKASKLLLHNDKFDLVNTLSISYILIPICLGDL